MVVSKIFQRGPTYTITNTLQTIVGCAVHTITTSSTSGNLLSYMRQSRCPAMLPTLCYLTDKTYSSKQWCTFSNGQELRT